jgi:hypothetical protein
MEGLGRLQRVRAIALTFEEDRYSKTARYPSEPELDGWFFPNKPKLGIGYFRSNGPRNVWEADLDEALDVLVEGAGDSAKNCLFLGSEVDGDAIATDPDPKLGLTGLIGVGATDVTQELKCWNTGEHLKRPNV